jgi:vancomycin permeability regulator SanA
MRLVIRALLFGVILVVAAPWLLRVWTAVRYRPRVVNPSTVPPTRVAIVFGAGLRRDGTPTAVLRDRVDVAADLYFAGKVQKLLLTGADTQRGHNEPESMRQYALELGVPDDAMVLDPFGLSTYDSCYRARAVFGLTEAVLVTQPFHLDRALYLCDAFGIAAHGVPADRRNYSDRLRRWWDLREVAATTVAIWNVNVARPVPALGEPRPIG